MISVAIHSPSDLVTPIVTLADVIDPRPFPTVGEVSYGEFFVGVENPNVAEIQERRVAMFTDSVSGQRWAMPIRHQERAIIEEEGERSHLWKVTGPLLLGDLERWSLLPQGGAERSQFQDIRVFNWANPSFDDSTWSTPSTFITQGTNPNSSSQYAEPYQPELLPREWSAPSAQWVLAGTYQDAPDGFWYLRWKFTIATAGDYILDFAVDNDARVYVDGVEVFDGGAAYKDTYSVEVDLPVGDHVIAARLVNFPKVGNNPTAFLGALFEIDDGERGDVVHSTTSASDIEVLITPTSAGTHGTRFDTTPPGMTVGEVLEVIFSEHTTGWTLTFDGDLDTAGTPWPSTPEIALKVGDKYPTILRQLAQTYIDVAYDWDAKVLHAYVKGDYGTATAVEFVEGESITHLAARSDGWTANTLLVRDKAGYKIVEDAADVATHGEYYDFSNYPEDTSGESSRKATALIDVLKDPRWEYTVSIVPTEVGDVPWVDFFPGDTITIPDRNGSPVVVQVLTLPVTHDTAGKNVYEPVQVGSPVLHPEQLQSTINLNFNTGAAGGRDLLAQPRSGGRATGMATKVTSGEIGSASPSSAQMLVLSASGDSIASGGDYVSFGTVIHQNGFGEAVATPVDSITWPIAAVGAARVVTAWDTYEGGGTVELEVDGEVPAWGLFGSGAAGAEGRGGIDVDIAAGSTVKLKVTQGSGSAQTCDVTLSLQVQDPTKPPATAEMPTSATSVGADTDINQALALGAPSATEVGDLMVTTLTGYSLDGAQGGDGTITPDPAWTLVELEIDPGFPRQQFHVYSKIADADDAAGTASYAWTYSDALNTRGTVMCVTIPQVSGVTLSAPQSQTARDTTSFSVSAPAGDWVLAAMLHKEHRSGAADSDADPAVTNSGAVLLARYDGGGRRGEHAVYAVPAGTGTITGSLQASGEPSGSLMAMGVTT